MADKSPPGPPQSALPWPTRAAGLDDDWAKAPINGLLGEASLGEAREPSGWGRAAAPQPDGGRHPGAVGDGAPADQVGIPSRAGWWAVPGAAVGILLAGLGSSIGVMITGSSKSATTELLGEAGLWVAMIGTAAWVSSRYGRASLRRDYGLSIRPRDLLWGVLAAASALAVTQVVLVIFANTRYAGSNDEVLTQQQGHQVGFVVVSLIVAVGAPFFEELFFRGFLRTTLQARFGAHGAVWIQAVFFGLAHLGEATTRLGNVSVVLAMFSVGVVLGYAAKLTRRLGPGMVAHCLFNLVAVVSVL